jgi:hypothetical protein
MASLHSADVPATTLYPLRLSGELLRQIREAARGTHLEQSEVVRQSIRLGLPRLLKELSESSPLTNVKPFPKGALARAYRHSDPGWNRVEAAATRAQSAPRFDD